MHAYVSSSLKHLYGKMGMLKLLAKKERYIAKILYFVYS